MEVIVIKRYNQPLRAHLDAALLSDNGIECTVTGDAIVNTPLPGGEQVTLSVLESDKERALSLLSQSGDL